MVVGPVHPRRRGDEPGRPGRPGPAPDRAPPGHPAALLRPARAERRRPWPALLCPLHGYGIILRVGGQSAGRTRIPVATLYTSLDRLEEKGLVAMEREEVVDGRPRRYYRITDDGVAAVRAEAARLQQAVNLVTGRTAVMGT
ncbi:PadR family transcriptional regulator [Nonomuraea angiospora]|uniref:PadR family transcriptional regulator n=1 Tax=Nonomuraea angiospora TaxID=46172 RepID=UPI0034367C88